MIKLSKDDKMLVICLVILSAISILYVKFSPPAKKDVECTKAYVAQYGSLDCQRIYQAAEQAAEDKRATDELIH